MAYYYRQTLYLIRGLPGSGKSTLANELQDEMGVTWLFEADMYFTNEKGEYNFNPNYLKHAHDWCQARVYEALEQKLRRRFFENVIVANTFTTNKELKPYFDMVDQINSFRVENKVKNLIRINVIHLENDFGSTHNVPPETIEKMRNRWEPLRLKQREF